MGLCKVILLVGAQPTTCSSLDWSTQQEKLHKNHEYSWLFEHSPMWITSRGFRCPWRFRYFDINEWSGNMYYMHVSLLQTFFHDNRCWFGGFFWCLEGISSFLLLKKCHFVFFFRCPPFDPKNPWKKWRCLKPQKKHIWVKQPLKMKVKRGFLYWQFVVVKFVNSVKASNKFTVTP